MSPKTAAPSSVSATGQDPFQGFLSEFLDWLEKAGLSANQVADARRASRHFLIWLQNDGMAIDRVDDAVLCRFRHHDCRCVHSRHGHYKRHRRSSRHYMSRVRCLVRFLEESGRVSHPEHRDVSARRSRGEARHPGGRTPAEHPKRVFQGCARPAAGHTARRQGRLVMVSESGPSAHDSRAEPLQRTITTPLPLLMLC